jgi:hypothetical protein
MYLQAYDPIKGNVAVTNNRESSKTNLLDHVVSVTLILFLCVNGINYWCLTRSICFNVE